MKLDKYNKKRNFDSTSEPVGKEKNSKQKRFVVQYHQARALHYDFRLEYRGVLLSWAVPKGLSKNPKDKRLAVMVEDHPLDYINFEGIIPKGNYGAGSVEIFDSGKYQPITDFDKGLKTGQIKFFLDGKTLKGAWALIKTGGKNWLIIKEKDEFVSLEAPNTNNPFKKCDFQLATLSKKIPKGDDWIFEIKYDGYRIMTFYENSKVKMLTRGGQDYTKKFQQLASALSSFRQTSFVIDGEIVTFDANGKSDFSLLQTRLKKEQGDFYYVVFDILALNGEDLRNLPLEKRKTKLQNIFSKADNRLVFSSYVSGQGDECFKLAKESNLEGIVAKKKNSTYTGKRNEDWLKIKCYLRQEFVIGGYTTSEKNEYLSALLLGLFKDGKLCYAGKVGTGFNESQKKELSQKLKKIETTNCPFVGEVNEKALWVKPKLVAEVKFAEFTKENLIRQGSFVGIREDKLPQEVKREDGDE